MWAKIFELSDRIMIKEHAWEWRRRFNPHHTKEQIAAEKLCFDIEQKKLFLELKALYIANRDNLLVEMNKLDSPSAVMANQIRMALDACVTDDLENTILAETDHTNI